MVAPLFFRENYGGICDNFVVVPKHNFEKPFAPRKAVDFSTVTKFTSNQYKHDMSKLPC